MSEDSALGKRSYGQISDDHDDSQSLSPGNEHNNGSSFRTRPIRSCTHCRQQKIKCNASETYPAPCKRCARMDRKCRVDPYFKPQKGGQVQSLRDDLSSLRRQVEYLQQRETLLASAVAKTNPNSSLLNNHTTNHDMNSDDGPSQSPSPETLQPQRAASTSGIVPVVGMNSTLGGGGTDTNIDNSPSLATKRLSHPVVSSSTANNHSKSATKKSNSTDTKPLPISSMISSTSDSHRSRHRPPASSSSNRSNSPTEYCVGDVKLSSERAEELHERFMTKFLPYMPIIQSNSAAELYDQSELLFWTVCLTASLSEPEPSLYNSLSGIIKQLAIETCWIRTPRSTHIVQALIILGNWPIPNEKVLDDCSYRFVGLARSLSMQLGLHRGKFIHEFSRTQTALPDAEKWRTRTWLACFFSEQVWSASLGLPPTVPVDYLIDSARKDESLPASFRSLVRLAIFYSKLVNLMGTSVSTPDGLLDGRDRPASLLIMERELNDMESSLAMNEPSVEIYFLHIRLMICCFAFLPGMPDEDQAKYVITALHAATRVITLISGLSESRQLIEYPIYMRQAVSFAALILFRLHLSPLLLPQHVESARQSVVTVHRLFRNMLTAWKDVENDISRTAKVLEKLNFVIITHPYLFTQAPSIITRMRSHLTASMFYELIWAVHEARRRGTVNEDKKNNNGDKESNEYPQALWGPNPPAFSHLESVPPLPFYNQITKDDFMTNTTVTPNGTTVTTLVPTHPNATLQAFRSGTNTDGTNTPGGNASSGTNGQILGTSMQQSPISQPQEPQQTPQQTLIQQIHQQQQQQQQPQQQQQSAVTFSGDWQNSSGGATSNIDGSSKNVGGATQGMAAILDSTGASNDPLHLDTLMQGIDWMNDQDDFLGWMDVNSM